MVDYMEAIKKPFSDMKTLAIGTVLGFIPIASILVAGYALGVGRNTAKGDNKLPNFELGSIITYIKDIVVTIIISIIYAIPGGILFAIGAAAAIGSIIAGFASGDPNAIGAGIAAGIATGGIFLILGIILLIVGGLLSTMGIYFYLVEGNIGAAFKMGAALKKVLTASFWVTVIVSIILSVAYFVLFILLSIVPVIGSLIGLGLMTYGLYTSMYTMFGQVFKETP